MNSDDCPYTRFDFEHWLAIGGNVGIRLTESRPVVKGKQVPHWMGMGLTAEGLRSEEFDDQR